MTILHFSETFCIIELMLLVLTNHNDDVIYLTKLFCVIAALRPTFQNTQEALKKTSTHALLCTETFFQLLEGNF